MTESASGTRPGVVHRAVLHRVLVDSPAPRTVRTEAEVTAVSADGRPISLRTGPDGPDRPESFDLVIAADGLRSRTRQGWPRDPSVRYAGHGAWRGVTSRPLDVGGAAGETLGRGRRFGIAPLGDGRVYWFGVATMPAGTLMDDETAP